MTAASSEAAYLRACLEELYHRVIVDPPMFLTWSPHKKQALFLLSQAQQKISIGANRTGKTEVLVYEGAERLAGWSPSLTRYHGKLVVYPDQRTWIVSEDLDVSKDTVQAKLETLLDPSMAVRSSRGLDDCWKKGDLTWTNPTTGNYLKFKSVDQGRASFQGRSMTWIGFDEEPKDETVYDESYARILDCGGQIAFAFTAVDGSRWLHTLIMGETEDVFSVSMGAIDNPHLPDDYIKKAERRWKPGSDDHRIRIMGEYILRFGNPYFDRQQLDWFADYHTVDYDDPDALVSDLGRIKAGKTYWSGKVTWSNAGKPKFTFLHNGALKMFRVARQGRRYIVSSDSASGEIDGDFLCAQVIDTHSLEQVAVWRGRIDPGTFGRILAVLASYYNAAMIVPETNFHGTATLYVLQQECQYGNIYTRQQVDKRANQKTTASSVEGPQSVMRVGWYTDRKTKEQMMGWLKNLVGTQDLVIHCPQTLSEMRAYGYLRDDTSRFGLGAISGHDDTVDALAIALQGVAQAGVNPKSVVDIEEDIGEQLVALQEQIEDGGVSDWLDEGWGSAEDDSDPFDPF